MFFLTLFVHHSLHMYDYILHNTLMMPCYVLDQQLAGLETAWEALVSIVVVMEGLLESNTTEAELVQVLIIVVIIESRIVVWVIAWAAQVAIVVAFIGNMDVDSIDNIPLIVALAIGRTILSFDKAPTTNREVSKTPVRKDNGP